MIVCFILLWCIRNVHLYGNLQSSVGLWWWATRDGHVSVDRDPRVHTHKLYCGSAQLTNKSK